VVEVSTKPIDRPQLILPPVDEVRIRNVEWVVINADNIEEKIAELTANGQPFGLFVLTGEGYENLGLNFSDIRALVEQQQKIILAYERYYMAANNAMDEAEKL